MNYMGNIIAVSSPYFDRDGKTNVGKVSIYEYNGNEYVKLGTDIHGIVANDLFGNTIELSDDGYTIVVGMRNTVLNDNEKPIKIYSYDFEKTDWVQVGASIKYPPSTNQELNVTTKWNWSLRLAIGEPYYDITDSNN